MTKEQSGGGVRGRMGTGGLGSGRDELMAWLEVEDGDAKAVPVDGLAYCRMVMNDDMWDRAGNVWARIGQALIEFWAVSLCA